MKNTVSATRKAFFIAGFVLSSWAPLVPLAKIRLQVDNGSMGLILLAFGLGSLLTMPLSGLFVSRYGCRRVFTGAALLVLLTLPALVTLRQAVALAGALFLFGAGIGTLDVAANIHAVITEKRVQRPVMSGFHALFSLGGIVGAGAVSALLANGVPPLAAILVVMGILILLLFSAYGQLLDESDPNTGPFFALPHGGVILLGMLCFIAYIIEGAMLDWSGVLLIGQRQLSPSQAGIGYTLFAAAMTLGRFCGDGVMTALGRRRVFVGSALMTTAGVVLLTQSPSLWISAGAFLLIGTGLSNIAPILFTATGNQNVMPDSLAVAAVSTLGYSGVLLGPASIGGLAQLLSLRDAFLVIAALSCLLCLCATKLRLD